MQMIKFAVNKKFIGKPQTKAPAAIRAIYNHINGNFTNEHAIIFKLISAISKGHPYTNCHNHYRKEENYITGQLFCMDFDTEDSRSSFDELLKIDFIKNHASFLHESFSSTPEKPRSRAVFTLSKSLNFRSFSLMARAVLDVHPLADPSCKDPVRLYFGKKGCAVKYLGNILNSTYVFDNFVRPWQAQLEKEKERLTEANRDKITLSPSAANGEVSRMVDAAVLKILLSPSGQKWHMLLKQSRLLGGYVASHYLTRNEAGVALEDAIIERGQIKFLSDIQKNTIYKGIGYGMTQPLELIKEKSSFTDWGIEIG